MTHGIDKWEPTHSFGDGRRYDAEPDTERMTDGDKLHLRMIAELRDLSLGSTATSTMVVNEEEPGVRNHRAPVEPLIRPEGAEQNADGANNPYDQLLFGD